MTKEENKGRIKEYNKKYYIENKEKIKKATKKYYKSHREEITIKRKQYNKIYSKEYRIKNKKACGEYDKKYYKNHKEYKTKYSKRYREKNKEKVKLSQKKYINDNPWSSSFFGAKDRCDNLNNIRYKSYGGRGIKFLLTIKEIKKLWFRDKAWLLKRHSIDRKDNDGNYTYENCQFIELADNVKKQNNKRDIKTGKFIKKGGKLCV